VRATAAEARRLPVPLGALLDRRALAELIAEGRAEVWRAEDFSGYAAARDWRGRAEIAEIVDSGGAARAAAALALIAALEASGRGALVLSDAEQARRRRWYADLGWGILENLVVYEHADPARATPPRGLLVLEPFQAELIATVTDIDTAAFPWFWWNDPEDFLRYAQRANVAVFLARRDGAPAGYLGLTVANRYGHLDRLAIHPRFQGQGLGSEILRLALADLAQRGCRRAGLSTQEGNTRSRRLYERHGFRAHRELLPLWGKRVRSAE
jgi:ribosomal protein S18 acetylase RimI-like enzyme